MRSGRTRRSRKRITDPFCLRCQAGCKADMQRLRPFTGYAHDHRNTASPQGTAPPKCLVIRSCPLPESTPHGQRHGGVSRLPGGVRAQTLCPPCDACAILPAIGQTVPVTRAASCPQTRQSHEPLLTGRRRRVSTPS
jgi:hypothetical protein